MATYDKDFIKESLTLSDVYELLTELGGEPVQYSNYITSKTICHCGDSHKLYYYDNTKLCRCFTRCPESSFDVFELVKKVKKRDEDGWNLPRAIEYVAIRFGFDSLKEDFSAHSETARDWEIFHQFDKKNEINTKQIVELKHFDNNVLRYLPHPIISSWEAEGITKEVIDNYGICYDPVNMGIIIPHYDKDNQLIGIRIRTLAKEEERFGKYKPATLNCQMYNHPLGFNLYNLNNSKNNIKQLQTAIVFEGEKSCLLYASYFGMENDISVAVCGSNLINYQFNLLTDLGVKEIIIGFDKQFKEIGDDEWEVWTKKLTDIHTKYSPYCNISFLFDKQNLLGYKMSPIDAGKEIFMKLYKDRIRL